MKILWFTTSTNNTDVVLSSLDYLGKHEVKIFRYDERWNEACRQAIQTNPEVKQQLQMGLFHLPKSRVGMDEQMLVAAREHKPDAMIYTSAWEGDFVPDNETLGSLNTIKPLIHLCYDTGDPPWWPQMEKFEKQGVFSLTVGIDGAHNWPGGKNWTGDWRIKNGLSLLTPIDPRYYEGVQVPFAVRPYAIAYGGNAGGWIRSHLVTQLQRHKSHVFSYRQRDDFMGSYKVYCDFLRHSKCVISVPFTGSNATTHVKGRPLECGWAGAALLEWDNPATAEWFTPRYEYETYDSVENCLDVVEYLAKNPKRCEEIAKALKHRVMTEHNPEKFWSSVFSRLALI